MFGLKRHTDDIHDPAGTLADTTHPKLLALKAGTLKWDKDLSFAGLVTGKRVVLAGPARTLLGRNRGEFIDSFDVVVRFNDTFEHLPIPKTLARDIGTRTDILYANQVILRKNILERPKRLQRRFLALCADEGIRYLVCTNNSLNYNPEGQPQDGCPGSDRPVIKDFTHLLRSHSSQVGFRVVSAASEFLIRSMSGHWPRTGFVALLDLLGFNVNHLHVSGMTLYHGGGHLYSSPSQEIHPTSNRDGTSSISRSGFGHNSSLELDLMRIISKVYEPRVGVDEELALLIADPATAGAR